MKISGYAQVFLIKALIKMLMGIRLLAVRNPMAIKASLGFSGVVRLLEQLEGDGAIAILRGAGAEVGVGARISRNLIVHNADDDFHHLRIGNKCHVGRQVFLDLADTITVGDRVTISMRVMMLTHTNVGDSMCALPRKLAPITIGDDVYIGAGAILLPGVNLGPGSIIAAGAIVTRDVDPGSMVAGSPARSLAKAIGQRAKNWQ